jgi:YD repeat-containing protein
MEKSMKINFVLTLAVSIIFVPFQTARAVVSVANGNYFVGAIDLVHPAPLNGLQIKIQRSYNSRSQYDGLFGYGWGTDYESYLIPQADGAVVIQESGGGDKTRFSPKDFSQEALSKQVDALAKVCIEKKCAPDMAAYKKKLLQNANFRDENTRAFGVFPQLTVGTKLFTTQRGDKQAVIVTKEGYVREFADGKQELFSQKADVTDLGIDPSKRRVLKGVFKVSKYVDPIKGFALYYSYNNKGQLTSITDKKEQTARFSYDAQGKVVEVADANGKKATYKYCVTGGTLYNASAKCGLGDLIEVRTTDPGVFFKYQYDNVHNLTRLEFANGKADVTTFWPGNQGGGVKSFTSQDGVLTEYSYWKDPKAPDEHFRTDIKTTYLSKRTSETSYEYTDKTRADGSRYRYRMVSTVDKEVTDTIYNECCGQPIQIKTASGETKFEYYPGSGLPKEKNTPSEISQWEYHPKFHGKITKVTVIQKETKNAKSSQFTYDEKTGLLKMAKTSDGRGVALAYDPAGRIKAMVDQDKRQITFKYGSDNKPSEISQDGVGSMQVTYGKDGQIHDVKSKGGRQISMSVAAAFQNLLEIIRPAGVQPL